MKTLKKMVEQLAALIGTSDLNDWETNFLTTVSKQVDERGTTVHLSSKQIDNIEKLYDKHFGD